MEHSPLSSQARLEAIWFLLTSSPQALFEIRAYIHIFTRIKRPAENKKLQDKLKFPCIVLITVMFIQCSYIFFFILQNFVKAQMSRPLRMTLLHASASEVIVLLVNLHLNFCKTNVPSVATLLPSRGVNSMQLRLSDGPQQDKSPSSGKCWL